MIGDKTFDVDSIPLAIVTRLAVLNRAIEEIEKQNGLDDAEIARLRGMIDKVKARIETRAENVVRSMDERDHLAFAVKAYQDEKPAAPPSSVWNEYLGSAPVVKYVGTDMPRKTPDRNGDMRDKPVMAEALVDILAEAEKPLTLEMLRQRLENVRVVGHVHTIAARMSELTQQGLAIRVGRATYMKPRPADAQNTVAAE